MSDPQITQPADQPAAADVLDEGLDRLAGTGPEFRGGLSNHGPMGSEAMLRLGRPDSILPWLDDYLALLEEAPRPGDRITDESWRQALGAPRRVADWELYLRDQLAQAPWQDVLAQWWPRLVPGLAAAATHGIIRTSHAARSLAAAQTPARLDEFARGLAYWAASYAEVPGSPLTTGTLGPDAAVRALPVAPGPVPPGLILARVKKALAAEPDFPAAVAALAPPGDVPADLRDLAIAFARVFVVYGGQQTISFLHAVTAPVAARSVLHLLPAAAARPTYDRLWQVAAALYCTHAADSVPEPVPDTEPPAPADLADRAVSTGDVHAIKLTEACLRLYAESPEPVLLHAAAAACNRLS